MTYTTPTAPDAPSNLVASPVGTNNSAVTLTWDPPSNVGSGVTGYKIEKNVNGGGWVEAVTTTTPVETAQATNLIAGTNYKYRVFADSSAGLSANSSNSVEVEMLDVDVQVVGNIIGGNTITITPSVTVLDGIPDASIDMIRLYKNGQLTDTSDLANSVLNTGQTYSYTPMYSYPTAESQFYVKVKLIHGTGTSWWTSNTVTLTPASSFAGNLSVEEFRTDTSGNQEDSGLCNEDACYVNSDLTLNIQPAGTDVIVKYEGVDGDTIFKGYSNIQQQQQIP